MSKYTNYEEVSQTYDSFRYASGVETMINILCGILKKNAEEISMLEAGCGTGNYSLGFLQNGIGKLTMIDASEGMLGRAREKVKCYGNMVKEAKQHELPSMPYPDESFDVVTLIQVLHHLDTYHLNMDTDQINVAGSELNGDAHQLNGIAIELNGDVVHMNGDVAQLNGDDAVTYIQKYPNLVSTIKEAYRVLKPQGVLLVDHMFGTNIDSSWVSLAPNALALWKKAFIAEDDLLDVISAEKFKNIFYVTRPGSTLSTTGMFENPELILDEKWRNCCSEWLFVNRSGELPAIIEFIKKKKEEGKLSQFAYEKNRLFRQVGETTTIYARKF